MLQNTTAFLIARLVIGISMFGHGLVRVPKLGQFSDWMVTSFKGSMMPEWAVKPFSVTLPVLELITGILLITGLFTRQSIVAGSIIMMALMFGSCLIEKWDWVFIQMAYGAFFAVLYNYIGSNYYSLDQFFKISVK